jgi:hypothetical protein
MGALGGGTALASVEEPSRRTYPLIQGHVAHGRADRVGRHGESNDQGLRVQLGINIRFIALSKGTAHQLALPCLRTNGHRNPETAPP